jgi:hypothetical protein
MQLNGFSIFTYYYRKKFNQIIHKRTYASTAVNNDSAGILQAYVNHAGLRCQQNLDVRGNQIYAFGISKLLFLLTYWKGCFNRNIFSFYISIHWACCQMQMPDDLTKISEI